MPLITVMAWSRILNHDVEAFLVRCSFTGVESTAVLVAHPGGVGYGEVRAQAIAVCVHKAREEGFVTLYENEASPAVWAASPYARKHQEIRARINNLRRRG